MFQGYTVQLDHVCFRHQKLMCTFPFATLGLNTGIGHYPLGKKKLKHILLLGNENKDCHCLLISLIIAYFDLSSLFWTVEILYPYLFCFSIWALAFKNNVQFKLPSYIS